MITKKQVISCISKALKVPNSKININNSLIAILVLIELLLLAYFNATK